MLMEELYQHVEDTEGLKGLAIYMDDSDQAIVAEVENEQSQQVFLLKDRDMAEYTWDQLRPVLMLESSGINLVCFSRVCGYFSQTQNWNQSKRSEREDRLKGDYAVH